MIQSLDSEKDVLNILFKPGKGYSNTKEPYCLENINYIRIDGGTLIIQYAPAYTDESGDYINHIGRYRLSDIARYWIDRVVTLAC
jgi:hypothetical protein